MAFAADLAEDIQGVYLLIARAAMEGAPCPPDGEIARACGSRSPGRARRLVAYMESRNLVVTRNDPRGLRIIALPDLGWETGPGDPNAYEEPQGPETAGSVRRRIGIDTNCSISRGATYTDFTRSADAARRSLRDRTEVSKFLLTIDYLRERMTLSKSS